VVGDHGVHFCEADGLNADSCEELLVGEGLEQFSAYGGGGGFSEAEEDDYGGEEDGEEVGYYEGEERLRGVVSGGVVVGRLRMVVLRQRLLLLRLCLSSPGRLCSLREPWL
jgi:hypothetical protein